MRALSAGGNYSDYANSGFCSTPLPGGGLLPSPPPYPSPPCRCCCLRHLSCLIFIIQGRPSSFKLFSEPLEPAPPRRHLPPPPHRGPPSRASHHAPPPLSFDKFIHIPTRKISRGNSVNLEREREKERDSLGRYKRKEERKERSLAASLTGEWIFVVFVARENRSIILLSVEGGKFARRASQRRGIICLFLVFPPSFSSYLREKTFKRV